jgi:hypothetical protein
MARSDDAPAAQTSPMIDATALAISSVSAL